ncbi:MAG: patatin-like phospholipase family protein [Burkholderiaceae bacterium]|nr:patatin-like phospholipase family protein [Burkholderiaceae bacterium]
MQDRVHDRVRLRTSPAALILTGGGARAAYQVGVLKAVAALLRDARRGLDPSIAQGHNPFPILVGTSAGAINATALACRADNFQEAVAQMVHIWENFGAEQVYRSDLIGVVRTGARWMTLMSIGWMVRRSMRVRPRSLLDNAPLRELLTRMIELERVQRGLEHGHLRALALGASSYSSGRHVTFYQALNDYEIPNKMQRRYVHCAIQYEHLLASSAIPFIFPAVALDLAQAGVGGVEQFGDGSMRQLSPISPAIHLGAERVLVVGVGQIGHPGLLPGVDGAAYPTLAQVAGHAMNSIFLDSLASDIERLEKMNQIATSLSIQERRAIGLRPIETLVISPSERLDGVATHYVDALPAPVRALLQVLGTHRGGGASLASYLLFESAYTRALIDLGFGDTMARRDEVMAFLTERRESSPSQSPRVVVL